VSKSNTGLPNILAAVNCLRILRIILQKRVQEDVASRQIRGMPNLTGPVFLLEWTVNSGQNKRSWKTILLNINSNFQHTIVLTVNALTRDWARGGLSICKKQ
jgi:hypothetical protein